MSARNPDSHDCPRLTGKQLSQTPVEAEGASLEQLGELYALGMATEVRRARASFYTPQSLTTPLVLKALESQVYDGPAQGAPRSAWRMRSVSELLALKVCDPACGAGAFLLEAGRYLAARVSEACPALASQAPELVVRHCLFGVDRDLDAVRLARLTLSCFAGKSAHLESRLCDVIRCDNALFLDWWKCFPEVGRQGGFSVMLGNPPFHNAIEGRIAAEEKAALRQRFPELGGTADYSYYFLALVDGLLQSTGTAGLVLPRAFLNAPAASKLRLRLNQTRPPSCIGCQDGAGPFLSAQVRIVALVLGGSHACVVGLSPPHSSVRLKTDNWWADMQGGAEADPVAVPLGQRFELQASMTTGMAYELRPFLEEQPQGSQLRFVTAGLVDPGRCLWGAAPCRYLRRTFQYPRVRLDADMPPALYRRLMRIRRPKVLLAGVAGPGHRLEAFVDVEGIYCGAVSTFTILDPQDDVGRLEDLCRYLNEESVAQRVQGQLGAAAMAAGLLTIPRRFLIDLPIPLSYLN